MPPGPKRRAQRKSTVETGPAMSLSRIAQNRVEIKVLDLGGKLGRKRGGVEIGRRADAAFAAQQSPPNALNIVTERRNPSHSRHNRASGHRFTSQYLLCVKSPQHQRSNLATA